MTTQAFNDLLSYSGGSGSGSYTPGPLEQLANSDKGGKSSEGKQPSDDLSESLGKSLDEGHKSARNQSLIPGVLTQVSVVGQRGHGVPPADVDYSSWGNEALWQW